jgi:hypothetical protein
MQDHNRKSEVALRRSKRGLTSVKLANVLIESLKQTACRFFTADELDSTDSGECYFTGRPVVDLAQ